MVQRMWGVSYNDYVRAPRECDDDIIQAIAFCTALDYWEIHAFTVTRGSGGGRTQGDTFEGANLRAETSHGRGVAHAAHSTGTGMNTALMLAGNKTSYTFDAREKGALGGDDSIVFRYSIAIDYDFGRDYAAALQAMVAGLVERVNNGVFDQIVREYAQDDTYPGLLVGQSTMESWNIVIPEDDDSGEGSAPNQLAISTVIGIAVGGAAVLTGAAVSLYCCCCRTRAGEWDARVETVVAYCPHTHLSANAV
jgi:hypothetical protein